MTMKSVSAFLKAVPIAILFSLAPAYAGANLVANGDFSTGDFAQWSKFGNLLIGQAADYEGSIFGAFGSGAGGIYQNIHTQAGTEYKLEFAIGNPIGLTDHFAVSWGGVEIFDLIDYSDTATHAFDFYVMAASASSELRFSVDSVTGIIAVGNIFVTEISPVPEPESYASLLVGLGILGSLKRRRVSVATRPASAEAGFAASSAGVHLQTATAAPT